MGFYQLTSQRGLCLWQRQQLTRIPIMRIVFAWSKKPMRICKIFRNTLIPPLLIITPTILLSCKACRVQLAHLVIYRLKFKQHKLILARIANESRRQERLFHNICQFCRLYKLIKIFGVRQRLNVLSISMY